MENMHGLQDGAWPALFLIFVLFYVFSCCSMYCWFGSFSVLFVCICVLNYCHRVATQLQLTNISYQISLHSALCISQKTSNHYYLFLWFSSVSLQTHWNI